MYENQVATGSTSCLDARPRSLTDRLTDEKEKLESRLEEINGVLDELSSHPETQKVMDAIARLGIFGY